MDSVYLFLGFIQNLTIPFRSNVENLQKRKIQLFPFFYNQFMVDFWVKQLFQFYSKQYAKNHMDLQDIVI